MLYIDKEKLPIIMSFGLGYGYRQLLPMISSHPLLQGWDTERSTISSIIL